MACPHGTVGTARADHAAATGFLREDSRIRKATEQMTDKGEAE